MCFVFNQAELVAQFLCCIPLAAVEVVLAWLKPVVPEAEQRELLGHVSIPSFSACSHQHDCSMHEVVQIPLHWSHCCTAVFLCVLGLLSKAVTLQQAGSRTRLCRRQ